MQLRNTLGGLALWALLGGAFAQTSVAPAAPVDPRPTAMAGTTAYLGASASTQVQQDWLVIRLVAQKEGADAANVQRQLKTSLAPALAQAQSEAKAGAMEVSTGQLNVSPRFNREGKTNGWTGIAELVLQGRDVDRITAMAGRLTGLIVSDVGWQLSPELIAQTETIVQSQAVARWRAKADALTQQLGLTQYRVSDIQLGRPSDGPMHSAAAAPAMVMDASADARSAPIPVQAGATRVSVNVSGKIWIQ